MDFTDINENEMYKYDDFPIDKFKTKLNEPIKIGSVVILSKTSTYYRIYGETMFLVVGRQLNIYGDEDSLLLMDNQCNKQSFC